ncbi:MULTISPECIES: response regulator transcription factor [Faecalicoccus]|uniref:response regulator transcription factor n=2 Tax=Erysipelotrichaceae TaxID=128827 RepID=UPI001896D168|nr:MULTISPECIES: response regulator transcription factor [Faecalicoccus]MCI6379480.1 response regulator transcription factor [Erysipelotrichaceae bacterium]MDB7983522.1 response regulator transcription factor [Faecalicoccus pleomorphus]MDY4869613.1 response regulator transcription factor [Faecalicoccus sp.]MDY5233497.1 response regulator transcription factor [Faecalicoccus sp.]
MYTILLVEDDNVIATKTAQFLKSWNYEVVLVKDFHDVMDTFFQCNPDLVLMDVTLPVLNGYHWTTQIRRVSKVPILFVSSAGDNMNIVMALSQGADDYITKPFELQILQAKIQALLRRTYDFSGKLNVLEHKGLRFVIEENKTLYQDQEIELSKNEAKILHILLEKKDTIVSREEMMNYLWKTDFYVDENTLSVNVNRLRKKLESIGCTNYIETKKGLGYKI